MVNKTISLSISPKYVKTWGVKDAFRELYQNALDQHRLNSDNMASFEYDGAMGVVKISNKASQLKRDSLLLGHSSKRDNPAMIGKFGEGYKLALLVLCREGYNVRILNYYANEVWTPKIQFSDVYDADVLTIQIRRNIFRGKLDNNLTIEVSGVDTNLYAQLIDNNLHLDAYPEHYTTSYGNILNEDYEKGKIFVGGLFIQEVDKMSKLKFGYDIKPEYIALDRDRKLIQDIDLKFITSKMLGEHNDVDLVTKLFDEGFEDARYLGYTSQRAIADNVMLKFIEKYGPNSVPVSSDDDILLRTGYTQVIVSPDYAYLLKQSTYYSKIFITPPKLSPYEVLTAYDEMDESEKVKSWPDIIEQSKYWKN